MAPVPVHPFAALTAHRAAELEQRRVVLPSAFWAGIGHLADPRRVRTEP